MSVSRQEVVESYRFLLTREPESEFTIQEKMRNYHSLRGLVESITLSDEFKRRRLFGEQTALDGDCAAFVAEVRRRVRESGVEPGLGRKISDMLWRPFRFRTPADNVLIRRIFTEIAPRHLLGYVFATAMTLSVAVCTALVAYMIGGIVNATFLAKDIGNVTVLSIGWIVLFAARGLATYGQDVGLARIGNGITAEIQNRIFDRLLVQGVGYFAERRSTEFMTNAIMGAGSFANILNQIVLAVGRDVFTIVFLVGTMVYMSPVLAVLGLTILPLALLGVERLVLRAHEISITQFVGTERILGTMQEVVQGFRVVKAFRLEDALRKRVGKSIANLESASNNLARIANWSSPLIETFAGIAIGLACLYGGYTILGSHAEPGEFVSFMLAFIMLFDPARRLARLKIDLGGSLVMAQALYDLFDTPAIEEENDDLPPLRAEGARVVFDGVDFSYGSGEPVLRGMSFVAEPGRITALVGQSGGGKTTVFNLLLRFYERNAGTITIDGQDVRDVSRRSLRDAIAYVGQDVFLFEGSIRENILLGRPEASEEAMIEACRAAFAHDFISRFPQGYDSPVGEFGSLLSHGQRQRISIARALLKDGPIVLLDEPTASLDAESEYYVQMAIRRLCAGKTTLAIAHRLNTIVDADRIHVIEDGTVVESGRHEDLLARNGRYASFYNIQFQRDQA